MAKKVGDRRREACPAGSRTGSKLGRAFWQPPEAYAQLKMAQAMIAQAVAAECLGMGEAAETWKRGSASGRPPESYRSCREVEGGLYFASLFQRTTRPSVPIALPRALNRWAT